MVFHWSCVLLLRSRIATRKHFIAVRLSSLNTAAHNRTHPIALSYLGDDLRFIGVRFLFSSIYIEQKRGYGCTLLRATRTQIAMNRQKETGKTGAATGNLNFPASYCDQSQTRPEETALDSRQNTNRIAKPRRVRPALCHHKEVVIRCQRRIMGSIDKQQRKPSLKWRLVVRLLGLGQVGSPEEVVAILVDRR